MRNYCLFIIIVFILSLTIPTHSLQTIIQDSSQNDAGSSQDAPDVPEQGIEVLLNQSYQGQLGKSLVDNNDKLGDVVDWYTFTINTTGIISFLFNITSKESSIVQLAIYKSFNDYWIIHDVLELNDFHANLTAPVLVKGQYYIQIVLNENPPNYDYISLLNYTIKTNMFPMSIDNFSQNDAYSGKDSPKDSFIGIDLDHLYEGTIGNGYINQNGTADLRDNYLVNISSPGYLNVSTNIPTDSIKFYFKINVYYYKDFSFTNGKKPIYSLELTNSSKFSSPIELMTPIPTSGSYLISLELDDEGFAYNFTTSFTQKTIERQTDFLQNDAGCPVFDDKSIIFIPLNSTIKGQIGPGYITNYYPYYSDTQDCYFLSLNQDAFFYLNFTISIESAFDNVNDSRINTIDLELLNYNGPNPYFSTIFKKSDDNGQCFQTKYFLEKGNYTINITGYKKISYTFNLTTVLVQDTSSISSITTNKSTLNLDTIFSNPFSFFGFFLLILVIRKYKNHY